MFHALICMYCFSMVYFTFDHINNLIFTFFQDGLDELMSVELGVSVTTSYDWSQTDQRSYEQSTETTISAEVAPGKIVSTMCFSIFHTLKR